MICKFCGEELDDDSLFCTACGNIVTDDESVSELQQEDEPVYADDTAGNSSPSDCGFYPEAADATAGLEKEDESDFIATTVTLEKEKEDVDTGVTVSLEKNGSDFPDEAAPVQEPYGFLTDEHDANEGLSPENNLQTDGSEDPILLNPAVDEEETVDTLSQITEKSPSEPPASTNGNLELVGRLMLTVILLVGALLALTGYLFADKFYLSRSNPGSQTITIISQPQDVVTKVDAPVVFFVEAKGKNLTYQWYYRKSGDEYWHLWKTHDQAKTSANANESWNGMQVYCVITDNYRHTVSTDIATIVLKKDSQKNK